MRREHDILGQYPQTVLPTKRFIVVSLTEAGKGPTSPPTLYGRRARVPYVLPTRR